MSYDQSILENFLTIQARHKGTKDWFARVSNKSLCGIAANFRDNCVEEDWLVNCPDCLLDMANSNSSL